MKAVRRNTVIVLIVLCLAASAVLAQDDVDVFSPDPFFGPPTVALRPCAMDAGEAQVCDMIATKSEDIVGVWLVYFNAEPAYVSFNLDGTFTMGDAPDRIPGDSSVYPTGTFTIDENGVFTSSDPIDLPDGQCTDGTYIARVIKVGDQPAALSMAVRDDCFAPRRTDYAYTMLWVGKGE
ncbi:MAG: hypothetical protein H6672_16695 [Anaerolineaceae bacterium]|nr:hypothetical protein [Anaerolineaceae bacterium]